MKPDSPRSLIFPPLLLFICVAASVSWYLGECEVGSVQEQLVQENLTHVAAIAAALVDGDLHQKLTNANQQDSKEYNQAIAPLLKLHKAVPSLSYVYTLVVQDGIMHYVLDTATRPDQITLHYGALASHLMDDYHVPSNTKLERLMVTAITKGHSYISQDSITDEFGSQYTALAPIRNKQGAVVGAVGVDLDATAFRNKMQNGIIMEVIGTASLGFICFIFIVYIYRKIHKLSEPPKARCQEIDL